MKFSIAAIVSASLAGFAAAQTCSTKPVGDTPSGNPISAPLNSIVPAGTPFTITWTPTTKGTVSIVLLRGPSTNVQPIACIVDNIANTGKFVWTPSTSLEADVTHYGIQIIVGGTGQYQYSTQFGISNDVIHPPSSVSMTTKQSSTSVPVSQSSDGQVEVPTTTGATTTSVPTILNATTTSSIVIHTPPSNSSTVIVATTHVPIPIASGSGAMPTLTVLMPTKNMTVPASLKTSKTYTTTKVTASASASLTSSSVSGTGSPISSATSAPNSGAAQLLAGSLLAGLGAVAAFVL